ncbi:hypothetical protein NDA13_005372 [Ustilago tritici]|nr:hypothetical protein NDA13_005372 [Ustilago tritici]
MKLNIAIVALALSSIALTLAAPFPMPMPMSGGGWSLLKKAAGKILGKSKSAAEKSSNYADEYVPQYERFSDATHPYIPKEHRASGGESSSKSGNEHSREASSVHMSHGGGDSSKPAERDPRHGGDETGHSTSPPDDHYIGMIKLGPPENYHIPQHAQYSHNPQPQQPPYISQDGRAWIYGPPGEVVPPHSSHDAYGFPVGEYHRLPPKQDGVGWL